MLLKRWMTMLFVLSCVYMPSVIHAHPQPSHSLDSVSAAPSNHDDLSITLHVVDQSVMLNQPATLVATVDIPEMVTAVTVAMITDGSVTFHGAPKRTRTLHTTTPLAIPIIVTGLGRSAVTIIAQSDTTTTTATLFFLATRYGITFNDTGYYALELADIEAQKTQQKITTAEYLQRKHQLYTTGVKTTVSQSLINAPLGNITIAGKIEWTDGGNRKHPVRNTKVEIIDQDFAVDDVQATVFTDNSGNYSVTFPYETDVDGSGPDIFIRVQAISQSARISSLFDGDSYYIDSTILNNLADGSSKIISIVANNSDDNTTAFSIHDALMFAGSYFTLLHGTSLPQISVIYPSALCTGGSDACYLPRLDILAIESHPFEWDGIMHEYGHYIQTTLDFTDQGPGTGGHFIDQNHATSKGKNGGITFAWDESWPSYFSITVQEQLGLWAMFMDGVGDRAYAGLNFENNVLSNGDDQELAIMRALWDIADTHNQSGDRVALGHQYLFDTFKTKKPTNFSEAYQYIINGKTDQIRADIGCILTDHKIAPKPTEPINGRTIKNNFRPAFHWNANGIPAYPHNEFVIAFYDGTVQDTKHIAEWTIKNDTAFYPTKQQWDLIKNNSPSGTIAWTVSGKNTFAPVTGFYFGCPSFIKKEPGKSGKLDIIFVVDKSDSMAPAQSTLANVTQQLIDDVLMQNNDVRIGVVGYNDFDYGSATCHLDFSRDPATIADRVVELNGYQDSSEAETVYSGLMLGINSAWRPDADKIIFLLGDAPPHDPEPNTQYTAADVVAATQAYTLPGHA